MHVSPIVFCEHTGNWAAAWRRVEARLSRDEHGVRSPRLIETRSARESREVIAAHRESFLVVELAPPTIEQALDLLLHVMVAVREAVTVIVASREMSPYEELGRELGAQAFVVSSLGLEGLRDLALRHLARSAAETVDVQQRIWENLPWS
jgi:hypothetical protein